jgi:hypothetical protein
MGVADSRPLRCHSYVRMQHFVRRTTYIPFRCFMGDVRREFMQRLSHDLNCTLGSYLRDAVHEGEGSVDAVACRHVLMFVVLFFPRFFFLLGGQCSFFL